MTVYLDNASTTYPKPDIVYDTVNDFFRNFAVNPGRGDYELSIKAGKVIEDSRFAISKFFGIENPSRLVFTLNATDSLNMAVKGLFSMGDHIITTTIEHNAVLRPLATMSSENFIEVTYVNPEGNGDIPPSAIKEKIKSNTKAVIMTHASNVFGVVQDIRKVGEICKNTNVVFIVDASQSAGHVKIDVKNDHIDVLAFSGHKALYGPPGTGCLYVKEGINLKPWREGGVIAPGLSSRKTKDIKWPYYLEAGTPNAIGIAGVGASVRFVDDNFEKIRSHDKNLTLLLLGGLKKIKEIKLLGTEDIEKKLPVVSFVIKKENWSAQAMSMALDKSFGIAVRGGEHCAPLAHKDILSGTLRVSPAFFNTEKEIEYFINSLKKLIY